MSRWNRLIVAAACLLTACGDDDDATTTNAVATTQAADTTAVASTAAVTTESANTAAATTEATIPTAKTPVGTTTQYPERFDAKHVTVTPDGTDGLRIREVVDVDFGSSDRHGYQRLIPDDFGTPTDVMAASPDAPDAVLVEQISSGETLIRIGEPNTTISGQHRYVLTYTLPDTQLASGHLALDIVGTDEALETGRFEVVVTGLELQDPSCDVGSPGTSGGCTLERDGDVFRAVISPLEVGHGITIGGTISARTTPVEVPEPPIPPRR